MKKYIKVKKNEENALRSLKEALTKKFDIRDFRLFGSKARGDDTPESDIDVMIVVNEINPDIESQMDDIIFEVNLENDTFISAIIIGKKEIEEGPMSESPIYKIVLKEGIPL